MIWLIRIPESCIDGQVVLVGGNLAGGSQMVGVSVSEIVTVSWVALNAAL